MAIPLKEEFEDTKGENQNPYIEEEQKSVFENNGILCNSFISLECNN